MTLQGDFDGDSEGEIDGDSEGGLLGEELGLLLGEALGDELGVACDIGYRNRLIRQKVSLAINESRNVPSITVLDFS